MADDAAPDLQGLKILVIDDSKTIRRTAETLLAKEGCTELVKLSPVKKTFSWGI